MSKKVSVKLRERDLGRERKSMLALVLSMQPVVEVERNIRRNKGEKGGVQP